MEPLKQWLRTTVGAGRNRSNSSFVVSPRGEASSLIQLDLERHADEEKIQQQKEVIKQKQQQRLEAYEFKTQPQKLFICEIGIVGATFEQLNEPLLPKIKYLKPRSHRSLWLSGPSQADERGNVTLRGVCAARSFSTYPRLHSSRASSVSPSSFSPSPSSSSSSSSAFASSTNVSTPLSPYARVGDPNCDSYMVSLDDDGFLVASVADGSNIGNSARDAASLACDTFVSFVRTELRRTDTIEGAGKLMVKALAAAHDAIITSRDDPGSTTLLGGALVELFLEEEPSILETVSNHSISSTTSTTTTATSSSPSPSSSPATSIRKNRKWGFVGLSIGDCRLFHYSASDKKVRDVTEGNYHNLVDIRDPGGRIGATLGTNADVRNLNLFFCPCEEGDVLVLSSDGIYSNMEPQNMGYLPQVFSLPTDSWNDSTFAEQITASKTSFCLGLLMNIFKEANEELARAFAALELSTANVGIVTAESSSGGTTENTTTGSSAYGSNGSNYGSNGTKSASSSPFLTPTSSDLGTLVVEKIVTHCLKITYACRDFVERNPYTKLPTNVVEYPGLMDHSTVLAINVGAFPSCCGLRPLCPFGAASSTSPSSSSSASSSVSSILSPASTSPASSAAPSPPTSSKTNNWIPNPSPTSPAISESEKRRRGLSLSKKASEKVLIPPLMLNPPEVSRGEEHQVDPLAPTAPVLKAASERIKSSSSFENYLSNQKATTSLAYQSLPQANVSKRYQQTSTGVVRKGKRLLLSGPKLHSPEETNYYDIVSASTVSTYPYRRDLGKPLRDGDPICDSYGYLLRDDGIHISCVADGCSWGRAPQLAAKQAKTAFIDFLDKNTRLLTDTVTVGHALLLAMRHAHEMVMKARDPSFIGTTTLLGGILLQLEPESVTLSSPSSSPNAPPGTATSQTPPSSASPSRWTNGGIPKWCWVYINVGDCKAFLYSRRKGTMQDITVGNRLDISDPRDPGGRLGPYVHDCEPDLRNLALGCVPCEEGDIICVVSDGVHDNLDPAFLGYEPSDLGLGRPGDLAYKDWDSIEDKTLILKAKTAFVHEFLQLNVLGEEGKAEAQRIQNEGIAAASTFVDTSSSSITPALLTRRLIEHCLRTTARSREFVEQRPNSHLPLDYKTFPGKMDHR